MSYMARLLTLFSVCTILLIGTTNAHAQFSAHPQTFAFAPALQTFSYGVGIGLSLGFVFVGLGIRLSRLVK
jgi:hypothetical protein